MNRDNGITFNDGLYHEDMAATTMAPGEAARPALALVNSRRNEPGGRVDDLMDEVSARAWLRAHFAPVDDLDSAALAALRALRDAVREVLLARISDRAPDRAALDVVNAAAAAAPVAPRLEWTDAEAPTRALERTGAGGADAARAALAADAIDLVTGRDHVDLLACEAPGCVRLLLRDHPRRHWCSTRCGDRVRARRYYQRHRGG
jgi:predicted RNA-binding Zn ribbon-like protein